MSDNPYQEAFLSAIKELEELKEQERHVAVRKAQLQETINALHPLVFPDQVDINSLTLPNALRMIIRSAGRPVSATDIKTKLEDIGFDISKYDNPLANILTAMNRMVENDEMKWVHEEGKKKAIPGPDLKPVPQPTFEGLPGPVRPPGGKTLLEKIKAETEKEQK